MKLSDLLAGISGIAPPVSHPALEMEVTGLSTNSISCQPGNLFIGMPGTRVDGGDFWQNAISAGAIAAIVSETAIASHPSNGECVLGTQDIPEVCAQLAARFYNYPAQTLQMVGVTGTNGKTTTTHLIEYFLAEAQKSTALLGTLYAKWPGYYQTALNTTPFAVTLQAQLSQAVAAGCEYGVMEVSSHSLDQKRVAQCPFQVAVFTNLTQDHLDYHPDMDAYFAAKARLFSPDYLQGRAIINLDDAYGRRLIEQLDPEKVWSYSTRDSSASFWTSNIEYQPTGVKGLLHTPQGQIPFISPLVGEFNVSNLLAGVGAALHLGIPLETIIATLSQFPGVPGRMERVVSEPDRGITVIVDYAHTPDSLENLLKASRPFIPGKMICVFGCGGDRDRTKRPIMGKIAAELSDLAVVTSDNPRTEEPQAILDDVVAGIPQSLSAKVQVIGDRAEAIRAAIHGAQPGDGVAIAGKGHEDYQILGTEKIHFDDREQAKLALEQYGA
ncbi:UDP-N-acetylmuramoyl-L-alanyl-D-glutamate--2,6-diaminopimelate ligase [Roseofilum casamattae]|uniref:UDP-N-acetylmuramoyl-L-alanyl-D-glutamate--2,6-diaminopimelate ligase n=1 Tax=Roseofilum casamattae BLCC-M143 TaxID=3022442 RepID=A0ABT7C2G0_9CYAN|nr:UDP-N-acetylmuramoyl-L-alanyl-D-glutamate--2,6-diaminopimelate ligase [Roseofilum casamattae]MDJ1185465.1 UDP-N-acetylmuramoyl-L-alanyl-D-glutamate--2,6-diaminopimelate ligase [Roseofilum casamattae BLCC-M143]